MLALFVALSRTRVDEIMDRPDLPPDEHRQALAGLRTINRVSHVAESLLPHVLSLAHDLNRRELQLLDVACGGGDVPIALARLARKHGVALRLILADRSSTALRVGRASADKFLVPCESVEADALTDALPQADIVTNSLFLHHLDPPQVVAALSRLKAAARPMLLISDLRRTWLHMATATLSCRLLSRSSVVHHDGPASVRAAFTIVELLDLARQAGLAGAQIRPVWPFRMLLSWRRAPEGAT
jgi:2-polyprenyl-3-methyl-5-hydroxy-6-metoxy-1,4-benzoquinol methylase